MSITIRGSHCGEGHRFARRGRADDEDDRRSRRRDDEDDSASERRPRRRRKQGGTRVWLWVGLGGGGALLVVAAAVVVFFLLLGSSVSVANYKKLKADMSEQEVVAILGKPTQEESTSGGAVHQLTWKGGNYEVQCKFFEHKLANWAGTFGSKGFLQDQEVVK